MSRVRFALLGVLIIAFAACGRKERQATEQQQLPAQQQAAQPAPAQPVPESTPQVTQPEAPSAAPAPKPEPKAAPQPVRRAAKKAVIEKKKEPPQEAASKPPERQEPEPAPAAPAVAPAPQQAETPAPPKPAEPRFATIPGGTSLQVRLQTPLDSGLNKSGDTFNAILDQDIEADGKVVAARGSVLQGKLSHVAQSGRVEGRATMSLQLVSLAIASQTYPIQTEIVSFEAESTKKSDATKVGLGAGLGAVIGAIAGGGKGAAIGAAVGAGAGGATVIATRGKEVKLEAEHKLTFALTRDIRVKLQ